MPRRTARTNSSRVMQLYRRAVRVVGGQLGHHELDEQRLQTPDETCQRQQTIKATVANVCHLSPPPLRAPLAIWRCISACSPCGVCRQTLPACYESIFSLKRFAFQTLRPFRGKKRGFSAWFRPGRRCAAASHFAFFQRQDVLKK